jgi:membrane-bound serine protease (ClpP class)
MRSPALPWLAGLIFLVVVPWPWNIVVFVVCVLIGAAELVYWWFRVRGLPVSAGAETIVGEVGEVVEVCAPVGKVRVGGELWRARCAVRAEVGEQVRVVSRTRLELTVEPVEVPVAEAVIPAG